MNKDDEEIFEDLDKDSKQVQLLKHIDKTVSAIFWILLVIAVYTGLKLLGFLSLCLYNM